MTPNLKPYPAMKDSGVEWLGEVPEHWEVWKLRSQFRRVGSGTTPAGDHYYGGGVQWVMTGDLNDGGIETTKRTVTAIAVESVSALRMFPAGSLLVAMYGATIGKTGILTRDACTNQACCVLADVKDTSVVRFLQHVVVLSRPRLIEQSYGGGQPNINSEIVRSLKVPLPPAAEQAAIVRYLDHVGRRVRRLVRAKRKLIALLSEQKQAIIHRAVTRGLDPDVPLKDSGVEWLGEVPEHWEVTRFKRVAGVSGGLVDPRSKEHRNKILIAPNHIERDGTARLLGQETADEQGADSGKYEVRAGEIVYCKIRPYLRKALIAPLDCLCSADMYPIALRGDRKVTADFLLLEMLSQPFTKYTIDCSLRAAMPKINREALGEAPVWLPPPPEQGAILKQLTESTLGLEEAMTRANREIELLNEYRTRLIADVVTGKLDVRDAAAALPEVDPLAEAEEADDLDADHALGADELDETPEEAEA